MAAPPPAETAPPAPSPLAAAQEQEPAPGMEAEPPQTSTATQPEAGAEPVPAASARGAPSRARAASLRAPENGPGTPAMPPAQAERTPEPALIKPEPKPDPTPETRPEQALSKPATLPTQYRAADGPTALVMLAISPWGEVLVDGKMVGVSPPMSELELAPGKHRIEVRNGTFKPYRTEVDLGPNETTRVKHKFLLER
jgi:serine/threonine-protein kinase